MKKKFFLSGLLVIFLLAILVSSPAAQGVITVYPYLDGVTYYATEDDQIYFRWAWLASTKGLVNVYQNHADETYELTNSMGDVAWSLSPDEANAYFSPTLQAPPELFGLDCPMPNIAGTLWEFYLDPLPAGTYTLIWTQSINKPVNDGFHVCTDLATGGPVAPTPSLFRGEFTAVSTIEVSP